MDAFIIGMFEFKKGFTYEEICIRNYSRINGFFETDTGNLPVAERLVDRK